MRGFAYDFHFSDSDAHAGLNCTFSFDIKDGEVIFKIFDAVVVYSSLQEYDAAYPIEDYLTEEKKGKNIFSEKVRTAAAAFATSMLETLERSLMAVGE